MTHTPVVPHVGTDRQLRRVVGEVFRLTYGPQAAAYAERIPAAIRYSGVSLAFVFGAILGGGFAPLLATWLIGGTGTSLAVSVNMLLVCLVTLAAELALRERSATEREAFVLATD